MGKEVHQKILKQQNMRFKTWQNISEHLFRNIASWQIMAKRVFQTLEEYGRPSETGAKAVHHKYV